MKIKRSRSTKKGRIEIIPMIDVMFFLLATFMLASLSMQNLHSLPVNLPQGHADPLKAKTPITLTINKESSIFIDKKEVTLETLSSTLRPMLENTQASVIVSADSAAPNGVTVQAMLKARQAGAKHFLIAVKHAD